MKHLRYVELNGTTFQSDVGIGAEYATVVVDLEGMFTLKQLGTAQLIWASFQPSFAIGMAYSAGNVVGKINFGNFEQSSGTISIATPDIVFPLTICNITYYFGDYSSSN